MLEEFIMQMRPHFGEEERAALLKYNFEDGFLTEYLETERFEKKLAAVLGVRSTSAVNNGTIALSIAALAVGVSVGDEVIVPNFTMIATPNSMRLIGANPVFCDVELDTWCLDRNKIREKITHKTKAVVIVLANGRYPSYDVDDLRQELNHLGIQLIEDAAQSLGSKYPDGNAIGTKGNVATLSFSAPKIISTGQGGLVFSRDNEVVERAKKLKDFGRSSGGNDYHPTFGINCKFTDLQAIIGCVQLERLNDRVTRRIEQHKLYVELLGELQNVIIPENDYGSTVPWFTDIIVNDREALMQYLKNKNIGSRAVYPEINKQPIYFEDEVFPNSALISRKGVWLPSHFGVTDQAIRKICRTIRDFYLRK
jgi:perosamine synthetase